MRFAPQLTSTGRTLVANYPNGNLASPGLWQTIDHKPAGAAPGAQDVALVYGTFAVFGSLTALDLGLVATGASTVRTATIHTEGLFLAGSLSISGSTLTCMADAAGQNGPPLGVGDQSLGDSDTVLTASTLTATASASATAGLIGVGGGYGRLTVGAGSALHVTGVLALGAVEPSDATSSAGRGSLAVTSGGSVSIGGAADQLLVIGADAGGSGAVLVSGAGSTLHVGGGGIAVGQNTGGTLSIGGAAEASAEGLVTVGPVAAITGKNSSALVISTGTLTAGGIVLNPNGTGSFTGATVNLGFAGLSADSGQLSMGATVLNTFGTVTLGSGSTVTASTLTAAGFVLNGRPTVGGSLLRAVALGGTLAVNGTAAVSNSAITALGNARITGELDLSAGASLHVGSLDTLPPYDIPTALSLTDSTGTIDGTMSAQRGITLLRSTLTIGASGVGGTVLTGGNIVLDSGSLLNVGGTMAVGYLQLAGNSTLRADALDIPSTPGGPSELYVKAGTIAVSGDVSVAGSLIADGASLGGTLTLTTGPGVNLAGSIQGASLSVAGGVVVNCTGTAECAVTQLSTPSLTLASGELWDYAGTIAVQDRCVVGSQAPAVLVVFGGALAVTGEGPTPALVVGASASGTSFLTMGSYNNPHLDTVTVGGAAVFGQTSNAVFSMGGTASFQSTSLTLGVGGAATLTATVGADTITTGQLVLGASAAASASLAGTGTTLTASAGATVGLSSAGTLRLSGGASARISQAAGSKSAALTVGALAGASGSALSIGTLSTLVISGSAMIGGKGTGTATVMAGGTFSAGQVAVGGGSLLSIGGAGATLNASGLSLAGGANRARVALAAGGRVAVRGNTAVGGAAQLSGGLLTGTGTLTVGAGGVLAGFGTVREGAIVDLGRISVTKGRMICAGVMTGTGTLAVAGRGELQLSAEAASLRNVFGAGGGTFTAANAAALAGTFLNWGAGDVIHLIGALYTSDSFARGKLVLTGASGTGTLSFAGAHGTADFVLTADGKGGTVISHG